MSRDVLADAAGALRHRHGGRDPERAGSTRARVVAEVARRRAPGSQRRRWLFIVPLAAVLLGSTAWADTILRAARAALASLTAPSPRSDAPDEARATTAAHAGSSSQPAAVPPVESTPPRVEPIAVVASSAVAAPTHPPALPARAAAAPPVRQPPPRAPPPTPAAKAPSRARRKADSRPALLRRKGHVRSRLRC